MDSNKAAPQGKTKPNSDNDVAAIKAAAVGRFKDIWSSVGISPDLLDGREHPCPRNCEGNTSTSTRFRAMHDFHETGAVICSHCGPGGDIFHGIQWWLGCSFSHAKKIVADQVGIAISGNTKPREHDIILEVCRDKNMPVEAFLKFGATKDKRGKATVARVPVYNENGEVFSYFDLAPKKKGWCKRGKGNQGLFFPGQLPEPGETWLLVEGVKDAAVLLENGYLACGLPTNAMAVKYAKLFQGVHVIVVPDLDESGKLGAELTASRLSSVAASMKVARLPGEFRKKGGDDVRDVWKKVGGFGPIAKAIEEAAVWEPTECRADEDGGLPEVEILWDESKTTQGVMEALGLQRCRDGHPVTYQRGGRLVQITCDPMPEKTGITIPPSMKRLSNLPKAIIRERILQCTKLFELQETEGGVEVVYKKPPAWLINSLHERGQYPAIIPPLTSIIRCPTLRPDGSVIQEPGYDPSTWLLYLPDCEFPRIAEKPTREQASKAAQKLLDVVCDFPFKDESHKSAWLSLPLTMVSRPAINGPVPLLLIDANTRGSGKTKACDVASTIAYGTVSAKKTWPREDEEVRKTITSIALNGLPAVLFDNIDSELGGASLDAALTATTWQDRILGKSEITSDLPLTQVWMATGNNVRLGADTARRTLYCRLESPEENPEDRTDFRHPDLLGYVREHRAELVTAAVTVMRAWFAAGQPKPASGTWGSFDAWNDTVRQAIVWCGLPDPLATKQDVRDSDRSAELVNLIHAGFDEVDASGEGLTSSELIEKYFEKRGTDENAAFRNPMLRSAISELIAGKVSTQAIGNAFSRFKGRVCKGRKLSQLRLKNTRKWVIVTSSVTSVTSVTSASPGIPTGDNHLGPQNKGENDTPSPPSPESPPQETKSVESNHCDIGSTQQKKFDGLGMGDAGDGGDARVTTTRRTGSL